MNSILFLSFSMLFDSHTHNCSGNNYSIISISVISDLFEGFCEKYFSLGIHPYNANLIEDNFLKIQQLASKKNCLAIGEIGLDRLKGPDLEIQKQVFTKQIMIAESMGLPVILHCVKSWNEVAEIKRQINPQQTWVFHGFNKVGILKSVLEHGLMIGIGASILTNKKLQEALLNVPDEYLLLETDDAPVDIFEIYKKVSEIKQISLQALEEIVEQNFKRTFKKWQIGLSEQN